MLDVKSVLAEGQRLIDQQKAMGVDLGELLGVARTANAQIAPAIQKQGEAEMAVTSAQQSRMAAQDAELAAIRQQSGVFGPSGKQAQTTAKIAQMDAQLEPMRAQLVQKMNLQFSDDPLGWLMNQFTLPQEIQQYNAMWQGREGMNTALQSDIQSSTAAAQLSSATRAQTSDAEAAASLTKIQAATNVAAAQATAETAQRSINLLVEQARFDRLPYETAKDQLQLKMAAENNQLAREREKRDMRLYEINLKRAELELSKARNTEAARMDVEKKLALAATALGKQAPNLEQFEMMQRTDPAQANAFMSVMSQVDLAKPANEQFIRFGSDLADSLKFLEDRNIVLKGEKAGILSQAKRFIDMKEATYKDARGQNSFKQLTKEQQAAVRSGWAQEFEKNFFDPNVKGSIYNIVTPQGLAETKIGQLDLSKSAIVRTLQKKYESNPQATINAEEIIGTATGLMAAAGNKQAVDALSREVAYVFQAIRTRAYTNLEPQRVGMVMPEKVQYAYSPGMYSLPSQGSGMFPGLAESTRIIDLTNPTEVKNMLLNEAAQTKLREAALSGPKSLFGASQLPTAQPAPAVQRGAAVLFGGRDALNQGNQ